MSEQEFEPVQGNDSDEAIPFDLTVSALTVEEIDPLPTHTPPNVNADKKTPWWRTKSQGRKERKEAKPTPAMPRGGLKGALENMYVGIGMSLLPFDPHCAKVIMDNAENCAKSMDELAKTNPAVRRVLMKMVATSALGTVIAAHAPIVMALAMHHIPALRERQEKMTADMAEMFAKMAAPNSEDNL